MTHEIVDIDGDVIRFDDFERSTVFISIPFNDLTMESDTAIVEVTKQDLARIVQELNLPEVI